MTYRGPDPKETAQILDRLVKAGRLSETQFRQMHHLGCSISSFRNHCFTVKSFRSNGNNRILHEKLEKLECSQENR
jgi:hypothetical protein